MDRSRIVKSEVADIMKKRGINLEIMKKRLNHEKTLSNDFTEFSNLDEGDLEDKIFDEVDSRVPIDKGLSLEELINQILAMSREDMKKSEEEVMDILTKIYKEKLHPVISSKGFNIDDVHSIYRKSNSEDRNLLNLTESIKLEVRE